MTPECASFVDRLCDLIATSGLNDGPDFLALCVALTGFALSRLRRMGRYQQSSNDMASSRNGRLTGCGACSTQLRDGSKRLGIIYVGHISHSTTQLAHSVDETVRWRFSDAEQELAWP